MTQTTENTNNQSSLINLIEIVAIVGSIGGAIASIAVQQIALVSIPLSATVALNWFNRKQLLLNLEQKNQEQLAFITSQSTKIVEEQQAELMHINEKYEQKGVHISAQIQELEKLTSHLSSKAEALQEQNDQLNSQQAKLEEIVTNLREIENLSQALRHNPDSAEFYYQRGVSLQRLGDRLAAIQDYNEAIRLDPNYAKAYHNRGILNAEIAEKKQAVDDLRKAAKYYFLQGDLDSYQQAKQMSANIHQIHSSDNNQQPNFVVVETLFS